MQSDLTDEQLMQQYANGDLRAFQLLYGRHRHGLYRFVAWQSPRSDWVDEIVQDTWANLHGARTAYTPSAAFKTYLYQIARHRLIDRLRQYDPLSNSDSRHHDGDDQDALEHVPSDQAGPDASLQRKQDHAALHAAIRALPGEQKEALILQQFEGMSLEQIAQMTAVPAETVKSRLRYAMRKLKTALQPSAVQGEPA